MLAQIPLPMNNSSPGYFDGMVEIAIFKFDPITRRCERSIRHPSVLKSEILTLGLLVPPPVTIMATSFERDRLPARGISAIFDGNVLSFDKAGLLQTRREPGQQVRIKVGCLAMQDPQPLKLAPDRLVVEGWCKPLGGELYRNLKTSSRPRRKVGSPAWQP